jgi:predicted adenylyl cyclase CyaB
MKETELTVQVFETEEDIDKKLRKVGYEISEEYTLDDIYMSNAYNLLDKLSNYEILQRSFLIRNMNNEKKDLVFKKKDFGEKGEVLSEEKFKINIDDIKNAEKFFECIGYKRIFEINNYTKLYKKGDIELNVQKIKNLGIFIEIEEKVKEEKIFETREKMRRILKDLPIEIGDDFDVKKAHLMLNKIRN